MSERRRRIRMVTVFMILIILLLAGIWLEINAGYRKISPEEMWEILKGGGTKSVRYTLLNLRLPRIFTSLLVGVGLAVSGCVIQGVSRNDMAEPGILGINAGAGLFVAAFLVYFVFGVEMGMQVSISYLSNSLFLALAATFPDVQFLLFFIIPIKAKWMALLSAVMYLYDLMQVVNGLGWMPYGFAMLIMIVFSLINFILYFLGTRDLQRINPKEVHRRRDFQKKMGEREQSGRPLHKCTVCGRTDKDFPDLEFRYCSKCDGAYEYCSEHLYTHKHIVAHSYDKQ